MAIISSSGEDPLPTGAVGGTVFRGQGGNSQVMVSKVSHANVQSREAFVIWGNLPKWRAIFSAQSGGQKTSWNEFSQGNPDFGFQGAPKLKSGAEHFAAYWNRWEIMEGAEPEPPYDVPQAPVWTCPNPPFEEYLVNDPTFAMVVESTSEEATRIFVACRQPTIGKGNMARSTMQPLVTLDFAAMTQGDKVFTACELAESKYGALAASPTAQQWFAMWERVGGYARVLRDPCFTPGWELYPNVLQIYSRFPGGPGATRTITRIGDTWDWVAADEQAYVSRFLDEQFKMNWHGYQTIYTAQGAVGTEGERVKTRFIQGRYLALNPATQIMRVFQ